MQTGPTGDQPQQHAVTRGDARVQHAQRAQGLVHLATSRAGFRRVRAVVQLLGELHAAPHLLGDHVEALLEALGVDELAATHGQQVVHETGGLADGGQDVLHLVGGLGGEPPHEQRLAHDSVSFAAYWPSLAAFSA